MPGWALWFGRVTAFVSRSQCLLKRTCQGRRKATWKKRSYYPSNRAWVIAGYIPAGQSTVVAFLKASTARPGFPSEGLGFVCLKVGTVRNEEMTLGSPVFVSKLKAMFTGKVTKVRQLLLKEWFQNGVQNGTRVLLTYSMSTFPTFVTWSVWE